MYQEVIEVTFWMMIPSACAQRSSSFYEDVLRSIFNG
jgi:hypothetical protein